MKVLMISGDRRLLEEGSAAHTRLALQRAQVERLDVVVWPQVHSFWHIFRLAQRVHYDVITAQDPLWRGHLAHHLTQLFGGRLNIQVHMDLAALPWLMRQFARFQLWCADSIRVVSNALRTQVLEMGVKAPIHVLPIYIDVTEFQALTPLPHERKTILWVGRFEAEKDPLHAIEILEEVQAAGIDAKLVMLGSGSLEGRMRELAQNLPVELPGWQDTKPYLQVADVVICTSLRESWGASIVEALAAGVPVVAPEVGIAREAGARIAPHSALAHEVVEVLKTGEHSTLRLTLPNAIEWARQWKDTLL